MSTSPNHGVPDKPEREGDLYKRAAEIAEAAVKDQRAELDAIRTRTVQYLAFVGSATAFLVGTSLSHVSRPAVSGFDWVGLAAWIGFIAGSASLVAALLLCRSVLIGSANWWGFGKIMTFHYRQDATVYTEWLSEGHIISEAAFYRFVTETFTSQTVKNKTGYLQTIHRRYLAFLSVATGSLIIWIGLVWLYGVVAVAN